LGSLLRLLKIQLLFWGEQSVFDAVLLGQILVNGIAVGAIYGLVALGFVLVYKATEIVSFSHGDLLMFAAFIAWTFTVALGWPLWLGFLVAIGATALLSGLINEVIVSRIIGQSQFGIILLTLGIAFILRGTVFMIWGVDQKSLDALVPDMVLGYAGVHIRAEQIQIILVTFALVLGLHWFFRKSRLGLAMQALGENQMAAYLMGIPVRHVITGIWAISGGIAAVGGLMLAPLLLVDINLWLVLIKGLIVAIIGSFHTIPGALAAGILIGCIEQLAGVYLDAEYRDLAIYGAFFIILAIFPRGLFGGQESKKV
jgi:branched-chain amino acid transport system permease protein